MTDKPEAARSISVREFDEDYGIHRTIVVSCDACRQALATFPRQPWMKNIIITELLDADVQRAIGDHRCAAPTS